MIHSNHEADSVTWGWKQSEGEPKRYEHYTTCYCGKIKPISVFMINLDEMCSIRQHEKNKRQNQDKEQSR